jgi:hypothetical protein
MKRKYRFFFLTNTTDASVLHRFSDPVTPWPSCQRNPATQTRLRRPANPRHAPRREAADQRLRRFRFFSCFRIGPKPLDKFLAETARRPRPEMAATARKD